MVFKVGDLLVLLNGAAKFVAVEKVLEALDAVFGFADLVVAEVLKAVLAVLRHDLLLPEDHCNK